MAALHRSTSLSNGLTVLTVPGGAGSLTAMIFVGAGSRLESRETAGIAHFLEHLFFKGTPKRPTTLAIATEIDSLGCQFNAFTSHEYTAYFIKGAAEYAREMVEVLSDLLVNALIPTEEVERERGVILEEMRMYHDMPQQRVQSLAQQALFGDSPAGWDVIGFEDTIRAVSREQIVAYRSGFYRPQRMYLVMAGTVEHPLAEELADRYLSALETAPGPVQREASFVPPQILVENRPIQQANLVLTMPGPSHREPERDVIAASMMSTILGGSMSSRLFIAIRERQGLCYRIGSGLDLMADLGSLSIQLGTDPQKVEAAIEGILAETDRLAREGVSADEMRKARAVHKGSYVLRMEDSMRMAVSAATDTLYRGRVKARDEYFQLVDAITAEEVQAAADRYLQRRQLRLAAVGPESMAIPAFAEIQQGVA
jgi:predicted Zn-dependent peptidase